MATVVGRRPSVPLQTGLGQVDAVAGTARDADVAELTGPTCTSKE